MSSRFSPRDIVHAVAQFVRDVPRSTTGLESRMAAGFHSYEPLETDRTSPDDVNNHQNSVAADEVQIEMREWPVASQNAAVLDENALQHRQIVSYSSCPARVEGNSQLSHGSPESKEMELREASSEQTPNFPTISASATSQPQPTPRNIILSPSQANSQVIQVTNVRLASPSVHFAPGFSPRARCCTESAVVGVRLDTIDEESHADPAASTNAFGVPALPTITLQQTGTARAAAAAPQSKTQLLTKIPFFNGKAVEKKKKTQKLLEALNRREFAMPVQLHERWTPAAQVGLSLLATQTADSTSPVEVQQPPPKQHFKRSYSFTGVTQLQFALAEKHSKAAAEAKQQAQLTRELEDQASKVSHFMALVILEAILIIGYTFYRNLACPIFEWQCRAKEWQNHYDDLSALLMIGGILFATGPTINPSMLVSCTVVYLLAVIAFGALGQIPFMFNSLASVGTWEPEANILYGAGAVIVCALIVYSFMISRSRYDVMVSCLILVALGFVYSSAVFVAVILGAPVGSIYYHPHHYMIAWHLCLLLRHPTDGPTTIARWILMGISTHGLAAYSADSMVSPY